MAALMLFNTMSKMNCTKPLKPLIKRSKLKSKTKLIITSLNNFWKDAGKGKLVREGIKDGISVVIGGVGGFASSLIGAEPTTVGLLASFGFNAMHRALSRFEISIGDK